MGQGASIVAIIRKSLKEILAEKPDVDEARLATTADIAGIRGDLTKLATKAELSELKADILKWVFGAIGFQTVVILGAIVSLIKVLAK